MVAIPSLSEGSPNVLLEAMAFSVPVVATEVGGIPEIVAHEKLLCWSRPIIRAQWPQPSSGYFRIQPQPRL